MKSKIAHSIKHRKVPNDEFITPTELAKECIGMVPLQPGDIVLDAAIGNGIFYKNYPDYVEKRYNTEGDIFLLYSSVGAIDWIITNPPYSNLDNWFRQSCQVCRKGFAYLLGINNLTPRRMELANKADFGLSQLHLCKVFNWFGMSCFVIFEKGKSNIISYDRIVWR